MPRNRHKKAFREVTSEVGLSRPVNTDKVTKIATADSVSGSRVSKKRRKANRKSERPSAAALMTSEPMALSTIVEATMPIRNLTKIESSPSSSPTAASQCIGKSYRSTGNGSKKAKSKKEKKAKKEDRKKSEEQLDKPRSTVLIINSEEDLKPANLIQGIKHVIFNTMKLTIADIHLDTIVAAGSNFCHGLEKLTVGPTLPGKAAHLTDAAVIRFAQACPNLVKAELDGATNLSDASLSALLNNCLKLENVSFCGSETVPGRLKGPALVELLENPNLGREIKVLHITDQNNNGHDEELRKAAKALSRKRKDLKIETGCSRGGVATWSRGEELLEEEWCDESESDEFESDDGFMGRGIVGRGGFDEFDFEDTYGFNPRGPGYDVPLYLDPECASDDF